MKSFSRLFILTIIIGITVGCDKKDNTGTLSDIAQITAFAFASNDSIPGFGEAIFVVDQLTDTGLIRMRKNDSVRFGTPLNKVVPKITYYTNPASVTFYLGEKAVVLTGYDTLDLSVKPIRIRVVAQNTDYEKWYKLDFDVHTMNGDLFLWDTLTASISNVHVGRTKTVNRNGVFYFFQNDGFRPMMYISSDLGKHWEEKSVTGLPASCRVEQIVLGEGNEYFFYADGKSLYMSANGYEWDAPILLDVEVLALYMTFNDRLWLAARGEDRVPRLYSMDADLKLTPYVGLGIPGDSLPLHFPVSDFSVAQFKSSSLHQHSLIAGGFDRLGHITNGRWSVEFNNYNYNITNIVPANDAFGNFAGAGIAYYGKFLYFIGGMREDRALIAPVYTSVDEGMNWVDATDTINNHKPKGYMSRHQISTFEHEGDIYIIGGEDNSTTYTDAYRGHMNSINWPEIGN